MTAPEKTRECLKCGFVGGIHMFHQKNKQRGRHKYCKKCRSAERLRRTRKARNARSEASRIASEEWVIARPLSLDDFVAGESMKDMKERIGIPLHEVKIDESKRKK